jgi:hypothetical protein
MAAILLGEDSRVEDAKFRDFVGKGMQGPENGADGERGEVFVDVGRGCRLVEGDVGEDSVIGKGTTSCVGRA